MDTKTHGLGVEAVQAGGQQVDDVILVGTNRKITGLILHAHMIGPGYVRT